MAKPTALDSHLAALADVAPADFVRERNALAAKLKGKDAVLAKALRALPKPSPVPWALNQIARHHDGELRAYLDAANQLQRVQTGKDRTADLRQAIVAERAARQDIVKRASDVLRHVKIGVTPDRRRRIADTVLAAATGDHRADLEAGRLTTELEPGGLPDVGNVSSLRLVQPTAPPSEPSPPRARLRLVKNDDREKKEVARLERERAKEAKRAEAARRKQEAAAHARAVRAAREALRAAEQTLRAATDDVKRLRAELAALGR